MRVAVSAISEFRAAGLGAWPLRSGRHLDEGQSDPAFFGYWVGEDKVGQELGGC